MLRTYKDNLPERLPLSQQKEFKRIKNLIIQEAVKLGELKQESEMAQTAGAHKKESPPSSDQYTKQKRPDAAPLVRCASALLRHMGSIFREQGPQWPGEPVTGVDRKLRRMIREKKIAMGHRPDDHVEQMLY